MNLCNSTLSARTKSGEGGVPWFGEFVLGYGPKEQLSFPEGVSMLGL
jgi:hypothetical protein